MLLILKLIILQMTLLRAWFNHPPLPHDRQMIPTALQRMRVYYFNYQRKKRSASGVKRRQQCSFLRWPETCHSLMSALQRISYLCASNLRREFGTDIFLVQNYHEMPDYLG
ncbi:hypothetical protein DFS33DRAFT_1365505 [Desarmillaria ectypa]|nr:hypothetical protein DFS33DRAFT_1365505 [Desarmillaria ectypa]